MKEQLIELETAQLAKERGFEFILEDNNGDWNRDYYEPNDMRYHYHRDSKKYYPLSDYYADTNQNFQQYGDNKHPHIDAPTQALLQKWLREKHDIHIIMVSGYSGFPNYDVCVMLNKTNHLREDKEYSYEEALEKGLQEALKLIK